MSDLKSASLKDLLKDFHFVIDFSGGLSPNDSRQEFYDAKLEEISGELNRRIYQLAQPAKPDEWFHVGGVIFNSSLVELVTGDAHCCSIHYKGFSYDFEGEDATAVWKWFQKKAPALKSKLPDWPEEELHG